MLIHSSSLHFPFPDAPKPLSLTEVAPGVLWLRLKLPFRLDHINVYLIEDAAGWTLVDAGLGDVAGLDAWSSLLDGPLSGMPITRLIVTHHHPDHVGAAGWLSRRLNVSLYMGEAEYRIAQNILLSPSALDSEDHRRFYLDHGLDAGITSEVVAMGRKYQEMVTILPSTFCPLIPGSSIQIGKRNFVILSGGGHSAQQLMLYCPASGLFFAADQILARISPNVGVWSADPNGDPLSLYIQSLDDLKGRMPDDVLVLPGHDLPFRGLHRRVDELKDHHKSRCAVIEVACEEAPRSASELTGILFPKVQDVHQMRFAFSETLAHINTMVTSQRLRWVKAHGYPKKVMSLDPEKQ
ncbi:MBL fold metallo-hydrolase [Microvirga sp. 2YAF29]|uniref:MBL fold metallo-hydrolase n=1 Tax=Microvirga sp. 2YAF29 TaxID=3233031 RepID=UPI003F9627E8